MSSTHLGLWAVEMTYIVGFKHRGVAYLAADTAVTVFGLQHGLHSHSTFGELHQAQTDRSVHEGVLKLLNLGSAAVAISGDLALSYAIVRSFKAYIPHSLNPEVALHRAVENNGPYAPDRSVALLVAIPGGDAAKLLAFDSNQGFIEPVPDDTIAQFGNISIERKLRTGYFAKVACEQDRAPIVRLTAILAILQSYGLHDYLMHDGVGGAFCGLFVSKDEIAWQKDNLFVLYDGSGDVQFTDMVFTIVRDNALVVNSRITNCCPTFMDGLATEDYEGWLRKWHHSVFLALSEGRYDYVIFLNERYPIVTVVELLGTTWVPGLYLEVKRTSEPYGPTADHDFRVGYGLTDELKKVLLEPLPTNADGRRPIKFTFGPKPEKWAPSDDDKERLARAHADAEARVKSEDQ
jgi:hypothetical protein